MYTTVDSNNEDEGRRIDRDEYDSVDSFIDDKALDEYFEATNRINKHCGFFYQ